MSFVSYVRENSEAVDKSFARLLDAVPTSRTGDDQIET